MKNLALFDLDHTLIPIDSDYEWGQFLVRIGAVDPVQFKNANDLFFEQYQAGALDPAEYLAFALGTLARFPRHELDAMHAQFMREVVDPVMLPPARALLRRHVEAGDLVAIITATNHFVTAPIAAAFGVGHLIAAKPEVDERGHITGKLLGVPTSGEGKVTHLHAWLEQIGTPLGAFGRSYFYSDSQNDIPLLSVVTHPVATNPNAALATHATRLGWPSLHLFK
ncbi:HAD family hydrolase [Massilia glaciei]|uniref:HAD family hydrolase n=1 Tax=Massilia glaciei TaxID=1524097 RepID=A0A2U2I4Z0_9BURK|nr:HAD family hydrolase [Massilia glaciei]PWF54719.1 HAD family hydrolase [Massilia glaciei]